VDLWTSRSIDDLTVARNFNPEKLDFNIARDQMSSLELQFSDSRILEPRILDVLASDCSASTACASSLSSIYSCRTPLAVSSNYIQDCLSILHAKIVHQGNCLIHA
jgi:hypothetical protein